MPNQPVILDDEALAEIEARRPRTVHYNCPFVPLSETERDALCQTVRAAWAEIAEWESHRDGIIEAVQTAEARVEELEETNTALREQLAENARRHFDDARSLEQQRDKLEQERNSLRGQLVGLNTRLAQVEKERDEMRTQLRAAIPYVNGKRRQLRLLRHVGLYAEEQP